MNRTFIEVPSFTKKWMELGLTDDDLTDLEDELLKNPQAGSVIPGTKNIRKIRIQLKSHGKRSGARVIYVDVVVKQKIFFLAVYAKNEKSDLSDSDKKNLVKLVKLLEEQ